MACSALGGVGLLIAVKRLPAADLEIHSVAGSLLDYAAIGLGACITALVLAISLAPERRVQTWSDTYAEGREFSTYSELLFVLSWAAMAQLAAITTALLAITLGGDIQLMPDDPLLTHSVSFLLASSVVCYAIWELGTVISTLSMIGAVTLIEAVHGQRETGRVGTDASDAPPGDAS